MRYTFVVLLCLAPVSAWAEPFVVPLPPIPDGWPYSTATIGVYQPQVSGHIGVAYGHAYDLFGFDLETRESWMIADGRRFGSTQENSAPAIQGDLIVWQYTLVDGGYFSSLKGHWLPTGETFVLFERDGYKPINPLFEDGAVTYRLAADSVPGRRYTLPMPTAVGMSTDPVPIEFTVWKAGHDTLWAEGIGSVPEPGTLVLLLIGLVCCGWYIRCR